MRRITLSGAVLLAVIGMATPVLSYAAVDLTLDVALGAPVDVAPPPLPVYVVPPPPQNDLVWMPGFWSWDEDYGDYYWVPGTWVQPPAVNVVWTPGYWGWSEGRFFFHSGYWGPHVGFYGGVNYGGGYDGHGFHGGEWRDNHYVVNRSVVNVRNATNATTIISYNGGPGGVGARPTGAEAQAQREHHFAPTQNQMAHMREAGNDHALFFDNNHGRPSVAATPRPANFQQHVGAPRPNHAQPPMHAPIQHDENRGHMQQPPRVEHSHNEQQPHGSEQRGPERGGEPHEDEHHNEGGPHNEGRP